MSIPLGLIVADLPILSDGWRGVGPMAADAEAAGAASFWLTDHLYWHRPTVDPLLALTEVAVATSRIAIGPCVLQMPLRDVTTTAKSLAYLDHLAPGRVIAGLGIGEHEREFQLAGHGDRFRVRGRLLDAAIDDLRASWGKADGSFAMAPAASVPIWVGGRSNAARSRAAQKGDGWIPHLCRASWFAEQMSLLDADLHGVGRPLTSVARAAAVAVHVDGIEPDVDPLAWFGRLYDLPPTAFARVLVRGSAGQVAAELAAFEDAGAEHVGLLVASDQPVAHLEALMRAAA